MRSRKAQPIQASIVLILALLAAACRGQPTPAPIEETPKVELEGEAELNLPEDEPTDKPVVAMTNSVSIADQGLGTGNTITSARVISDRPGWLVVHAQEEGTPGPTLGFAPVTPGENRDVTVPIDAARATDTLYAMLHVDAGIPDEYEFPGDDVPATDADGNVVLTSFTVDLSGVNAVSASDQPLGEESTFTVAAVRSTSPGWIVIYAQSDDEPGPVLGFAPVNEGENREVVVKVDVDDLTDVLYAMLHLDAGTEQLFEFPGPDVPVTDASGEIASSSFTVLPSTVQMGYDSQLGAFLVDSKGMTLYRFRGDEAGKSRCTGQCVDSWPPLLLAEGEILSTGPGIYGDLDLVERAGGLQQVTYDDAPLYTFNGDENPGDTSGQGADGAWFIVIP